MIGVLVNTATVIIGSLLGLLLKRGIPPKINKAVMVALGLCTLYIGIDGAMKGSNAIALIASMVFGTILGTIIDIDDKMNRFGTFVETKFRKEGQEVNVAEGLVTASLLFCVGAMTIVGSLNAGLTGDNTLLFTKSVLDLISSFVLSSALGIGVLLAAVVVLVLQGGLVLLAGLLQGILTDAVLIGEITCAGSVIVIGLGLNMLGVTKIKVANMLPAILFAPLFYYLFGFLPI